MKCLILFLFCGVLGELPVTTFLPSLELDTLTELPNEAMNGAVEDIESMTMESRQNEVENEIIVEVDEAPTDAPIEAPVEESSTTASTTTTHFLQAACTADHMEWNTCGPRCYQTCAFQPRGTRTSRAVCESPTASGCHAGCFCESGYVRLNDKCVLAVDCPTRSCIFANEEFKECGTPCQINCDSYSRIAEIENRCPNDICVRGCFCKHGYVRSTTGLCILPTRCPRPIVI